MMTKSKSGIAFILAVMMFCMTSICATAQGEAPAMVVEEPVAGEYSEDAGGGYDEFEEIEYPGMTVETEEPAEQPTAVPTAVPLPTEIPQETESPYTVTFVLPSGWTNTAKGTVTAQIKDPTGLGVQNVEYSLNGSWQDATREYMTSANGEIAITVRENCTVMLRITDPHGHTFEENAAVSTFDRTVPAIQASIEGEYLHVQSQDDGSGIGGIQVNGLLFTAIDNGVLNVRIPDVLSKYDHLAVRAFDYAGNFSNPVTLDNPFYQVATPTQASQSTPAPGTPDATATPEPTVTQPVYYPTAEPYYPAASPTPQIIYVTPEQPAETPTPVIQTEYITIGPGMPYLADGNGHTLDVLYSAATNKQFITMQTKSGNVFYLVIDYDKPIDEAAEMYETYFLNLVDERDLLSLMSEEEMPTATPQVIYVTPEPTAEPLPTQIPVPVTTEEPAAKPEKSPVTGILTLVLILAAAGGGVFWFIKNKGKGSKKNPASGFDFDDDDEEDEEEDKDEEPDKES